MTVNTLEFEAARLFSELTQKNQLTHGEISATITVKPTDSARDEAKVETHISGDRADNNRWMVGVQNIQRALGCDEDGVAKFTSAQDMINRLQTALDNTPRLLRSAQR